MRFRLFLASCVALLALAPAAAAHHMTVNPPGGGNAPSDHPVGGPVLPENAQGQGLHRTPFGTMSAAHSAGPNDDKGLVQACESTRANPSVVTFAAPPFFTGCMHGRP